MTYGLGPCKVLPEICLLFCIAHALRELVNQFSSHGGYSVIEFRIRNYLVDQSPLQGCICIYPLAEPQYLPGTTITNHNWKPLGCATCCNTAYLCTNLSNTHMISSDCEVTS